MEIERKFLVKNIPKLDNLKFKSVSQGYLSFEPEIRIRKMNDNEFYITLKTGEGLSREEREVAINEVTFQILLHLIKGRVISKTRYYIPLESGVTAELDIYYDELDKLSTVEIEFDSEEQALTYTIPEWFGKDVTFDKRYKNKNLAKCSKEELSKLLSTKEIKKLELKNKETSEEMN